MYIWEKFTMHTAITAISDDTYNEEFMGINHTPVKFKANTTLKEGSIIALCNIWRGQQLVVTKVEEDVYSAILVTLEPHKDFLRKDIFIEGALFAIMKL